MDELTLHGREGDRDAITAATDGLMLVVGDSGIGKSSFLASLTTWLGEPLISSPVVLKSVEGALQTALADAISDCMSQYLDGTHDIGKAWTVVKSIANSAKTITGQEIRNAIAARALAYAESKLGKEAVDIGKKVLDDVVKGGKLGFEDELASTRVPDRAKELCDVAAGLSGAVGRNVVLRLDNAERLSPSDHGLLAELVDAAAGRVRIVVCITPHHGGSDKAIHQVETRGIEPHVLLPLAHPAIEEWLLSAQVPQARWDTIIRLSSGYPFFIADAIRLSDADASLDEIATPSGFEALMRASWRSISEENQRTAARLAPFVDPPSDDFLHAYIEVDVLQWGSLVGRLIGSGIFVHRSDGSVWFHDRRRDFIWERVLGEKERKFVAEAAFSAVASWVDGRTSFELWVPSATAVLARAAEPSAGSLVRDLLTLPDEGIALLWGLIEVTEPSSMRAPFAEIGEVVRHAETRSGRTIDAMVTMTQLEAKGLIYTREADNARLVRSNVQDNTDYAALLGEIQLRFHTIPRPRLATAVFDAFVRPVMGSFDAAVITLGRSSLVTHKDHAKLLCDPTVIGNADRMMALGATVSIDDQPVSFTAKFTTRKARDEAERALVSIAELTSRVRPDRVVPLPQSRLRYARYRLATESLKVKLAKTLSPTPDEIIEFLTLRAHFSAALASVSTADETEVLDLGLRRFLVDAHTAACSWTSFEVRTDSVQPTCDISELALDLRNPLLDLQLRASGYLLGRERVVRTVTQSGSEMSIPHPLTAVLDDIDKAGKEYNAGLRSMLFPPSADVLERELIAERRRLHDVMSALESANVTEAKARRHSLLVGFWEGADSAWASDFGNWRACILKVDDDQGAVVVRRLPRPPIDISTSFTVTVPEAFSDHAGATVTSWQYGDASSVIAPLLGYSGRDARMMDLDTPLGRIMRTKYDIVGEGELAS